MNTNHSLFPVKLIRILELFEGSQKGRECIKRADDCMAVNSPEDNKTRAVLSSPQLFQVLYQALDLDEMRRIRLAYHKDMLHIYETSLELYNHSGELLQVITHPEWSMELSLAIETELLERVLNINPL